MTYDVDYVLKTKHGTISKSVEIPNGEEFDNDLETERYLTQTIAKYENVPALHIRVVIWN